MVHDSISEDRPRELGRSRSIEGVDQGQVAIDWHSVVDSQIETLYVRYPNQASSGLIVQGCDSAMSYTKSSSIKLWRVCNFGEGWHAVCAGEHKDVRLIVDDVDIDVATFERIDTGTCVDRVLILVDLYGSVAFVWSVLITSQIVKIEPVCLSTLASDNPDAADVSTGILAGQNLEW